VAINWETPIIYHRDLDTLAQQFGYEPTELCWVTEKAIREHHRQATIEEGHYALGRQPDVYNLKFSTLYVYYTIESQAVVVRGDGWDLDRDPLDDFDGGGYYCDYEWMLPSDAQSLTDVKEEQR
jgi:hypothetical protein